MNRRIGFITLGVAAIAASIAVAQTTPDGRKAPPAKPVTPPTKTTAPAGAPQGAAQGAPALPPGMSEKDMQACTEAATPGPMHARLTEEAGLWTGASTMWMTPTAEPMKSTCACTITPMMDGRFTKCEITGDMPGMGPFNGMGIYGYDNVSQKFQATWLDNCGTGMMVGTGDLSSDGSTLTWTFTFNCPITKKATTMREVERRTGPTTKTLEMFGPDPTTGKEFKMMEIAFTRAPRTSVKSATGS